MVVDVQCDYLKADLGNMKTGDTEMGALEATLRTIGSKIGPKCLTLIETTVAPGTTEFVGWPILKKAFASRGIDSEPLLSHSFERVMPGREYVSSIRDMWRVCSGCDAEARARVEKFLTEVLNTEDYPLTVMDRPIESETTKIVENSYRAALLAFLNEWSLFSAEWCQQGGQPDDDHQRGRRGKGKGEFPPPRSQRPTVRFQDGDSES